MSEYQCYEFVALERPLTAKQMAELRAISTRAEISPTRFWNEYQWGNLKADPAKLMEHYFDAHLYFANWGTHRLMLRMPKARTDLKALKPYFVGGHAARLTSVGEHVLLDLGSDTEEPEDELSQGSLAALSPLRAELLRGDLRPAYLAWLLAVNAGDLDDDAEEPPVPAGLAELTAAQEAMVEFLLRCRSRRRRCERERCRARRRRAVSTMASGALVQTERCARIVATSSSARQDCFHEERPGIVHDRS